LFVGSSADQDEVLSELRGHVARLERSTKITARGKATLPFGLPCLDHHPPGGLPLGALHEVGPGGCEPEHGAAAILFTAGILGRLKGPVLWCLASRDLFAPAPARAGSHPDRVIYAETW
jgi:protein ImuA